MSSDFGAIDLGDVSDDGSDPIARKLELAEEFRDYAQRGGQVFISTHSPDFLNALTLDEIYCLRKDSGFSVITRASASENLRSLYAAGDLPGYLWKQGLFEGVNR